MFILKGMYVFLFQIQINSLGLINTHKKKANTGMVKTHVKNVEPKSLFLGCWVVQC